MEEDTYVRYAENELFNNSIAATAVAKSAAPGWASNTSGYVSAVAGVITRNSKDIFSIAVPSP